MIHPARLYAMEQANKLVKLSLNEFFKRVQSQFYPGQDISFMEYFLELTQYEDEFVVPHIKLLECGVMTSTRSSNVLEKLINLGLENGVHFTLLDIQQRGKSGAQTSKQYTLTPEAFKLSLMSAKKYPGQTVNPLVYRKYYILLEKVFKLYTDYEREYSKCLLAMKDDKIDQQSKKIDQLTEDMQKVLARTDHIIVQNEQLHIKFDAMFEYLLSFAKMTIPTWVGSLVMHRQYQTFVDSKGSGYAMGHMKVLFMVGFYTPLDDHATYTKRVGGRIITFTGKARMHAYCCCTNMNNISKRISELYDKYTNGKDPMFMIRPLAITLMSCEINLERNDLEALDIFPEQSIAVWKPKYKRFDLTISKDSYSEVNAIFETMRAKATTQRFQGYQKRVQQFNRSNDAKVDPRIIKYIDNVDTDFYSSSRPFCQMYLDSYTTPTYADDDDDVYEYAHCTPSLEEIERPDFKNRSLSQHKYSLSMLNRMLKKSADIDYVQLMAEQGILCKNDLPSLKAMAKFEKIDVSKLEPPVEYDSE